MKDSLKAKDIKLMVDVFGSRFVRNNVWFQLICMYFFLVFLTTLFITNIF
jgi:hypothetical protein